MQRQRHYVISIAGFDPSAGAGILSDIKTFEQTGVYGLGVCSAITVQTEDRFESMEWIPAAQIFSQLQLLLENYKVDCIKIGIIESLELMEKILDFLQSRYPHILVLWDPVLKASAGFDFHDELNEALVKKCCEKVFLITPNAEEASRLINDKDAYAAAAKLSEWTSVFLKSHRNIDGMMNDVLFYDGTSSALDTEVVYGFEKHGSGCVLSSAITAFLASGYDVKQSCIAAKAYTLEFLKSSTSLLGEHHDIKSFWQHA